MENMSYSTHKSCHKGHLILSPLVTVLQNTVAKNIFCELPVTDDARLMLWQNCQVILVVILLPI
jgi:hypothetical protein